MRIKRHQRMFTFELLGESATYYSKKVQKYCFGTCSPAKLCNIRVLSILSSKKRLKGAKIGSCVRRQLHFYWESLCESIKQHNRVSKTITFHLRLTPNVFSQTTPGTSRRSQDFLGFFILRYVDVFCFSLLMVGVYLVSSFSSEVSSCT